jgi:drug/metabolite transporter (DMT)-like permease
MRHPRKLELIGLMLALAGVILVVRAVTLGLPGVITGSLLCIAGIVIFVMD